MRVRLFWGPADQSPCPRGGWPSPGQGLSWAPLYQDSPRSLEVGLVTITIPAAPATRRHLAAPGSCFRSWLTGSSGLLSQCLELEMEPGDPVPRSSVHSLRSQWGPRSSRSPCVQPARLQWAPDSPFASLASESEHTPGPQAEAISAQASPSDLG